MSRAISVDDTSTVIVWVQASDGRVYELNGLWNNTEGTLSTSGSTKDMGFELTGSLQSGTAKIKTASGDEWNVVEHGITPAAVEITGTPETMAAGIPESWWGLYDYSALVDPDNGGAVEAWMVGNPGDWRGAYYMVLGPYSMDYWPNLDILAQHQREMEAEASDTWRDRDNDGDVDADDQALFEEYLSGQLEADARHQSAWTVLEVTELTRDSEYEILLLWTVHEDFTDVWGINNDASSTEITKGDATYRQAYRKIKMTKSGNKITGTLAGDPGIYGTWFYFKTAADAKAATYISDLTNFPGTITMVFETNW